MKDKENKKGTTKTSTKGTKYLKIIIFILLLVALFTGVMFGTVKILTALNEEATPENCSYVAQLDESNYYIAQAPQNIKFKVSTSDISDYSITNSNNENIDFNISNNGENNYLTAKDLYEKGQTYNLKINNNEASIVDTNLTEARTVTFKIDQDEVADYTLKDNVKVVNSLDGITETDGVKTLNVAGNTYSQDDIIVVKENDKFTQAYKVDSVNGDIATLSNPKLTDIYNDLEIYKELNVNFDNIEIDDNIKDQVELAYVNTEWYQFLVNECYADVEHSISIETNGEKISISFQVTVKQGNDDTKIGIKALSKHNIILTFKTDLTCKILPDINIRNHFNLSANTTEDSDFSIKFENKTGLLEGIDSIKSEDYDQSLENFMNLLNGNIDVSSSKARIYGLEVPTGLGAMNVYIDFYIQTSFSVNANITVGEKVGMIQVVGFTANSNGITPYSNFACTKAETYANIQGKAEERVGLGADIGASFISKDIASIGFSTEGGIYGDEYIIGELDINEKEIKESYGGVVGEVEYGIYFNAGINAHINLLFKDLSYSENIIDKKIPIKKYGSFDITTGIQSESQNITITGNNFTMPTIYKKIKNLKTGSVDTSQAINPSYLEITDVNGNAISGSMNLDSNNQATLVIKYKEGLRSFQTQIKVTVKSNNSGQGFTINKGSGNSQSSTDGNESDNNTTSKRLTEEEAKKLAIQKWGSVDSETGYKLGYLLEAMVKDSSRLRILFI